MLKGESNRSFAFGDRLRTFEDLHDVFTGDDHDSVDVAEYEVAGTDGHTVNARA